MTDFRKRQSSSEVYRSLNELLRTLSNRESKLTIACECRELACAQLITIPAEEYEDVRADGALYIVADGHAHTTWDEIEAERGGYHVVRDARRRTEGRRSERASQAEGLRASAAGKHPSHSPERRGRVEHQASETSPQGGRGGLSADSDTEGQEQGRHDPVGDEAGAPDGQAARLPAADDDPGRLTGTTGQSTPPVAD